MKVLVEEVVRALLLERDPDARPLGEIEHLGIDLAHHQGLAEIHLVKRDRPDRRDLVGGLGGQPADPRLSVRGERHPDHPRVERIAVLRGVD